MGEPIELKSKRKPCIHCGAVPACPDYTCKRLKSVGLDDESPGYQQFEYVTDVGPREVHIHFHGTDGEKMLTLLDQIIGDEKN